jgi:hypothetical protein
MRALFKASILFCFIGLGLLLIYIFAMLNWSYAEGERAGYIQKFFTYMDGAIGKNKNRTSPHPKL